MVMPFADNRIKNSLASKMRMKRYSFFMSLINNIVDPITILDVGGTASYWNVVMISSEKKVEITLLNRTKQVINNEAFVSLEGDACNLNFRDQSFDIVFSNSVIEHVGDLSDQKKMASEVRRVGKRYFLQTPNRSFPIEPHYIFPFFQFFPLKWQKWLIMHFNLGWMQRQTTDEGALEMINSIRLLNKQELINLFPGGKLFEEKIFGLTKSFIIYSGWD
jgi:2-polyprenyl-3-methyl-5-hydroxy-6-metoxy-1,4-benzoquinol methylase